MMECATISVASIPILADGIKWLGYSPKHKFLWKVDTLMTCYRKASREHKGRAIKVHNSVRSLFIYAIQPYRAGFLGTTAIAFMSGT